MYANAPLWSPARRGWYEVWYLILADAANRNGYWIRYTLLAPADAKSPGECALWFVRFSADHPERNLALKESHPLEGFSAPGPGFKIRIADAWLDEGGANGSIRTADHEVSWDFKHFSGGQVYHPIPASLRRPGLARSVVSVPHWNGEASGDVRVDGNAFCLRRTPLTQAHIHGARYSPGWQWAHCNAFAGTPELVAEGLCGRLRVAGIASPALTSFGCAGVGMQYETGSLWALLRNRARLGGRLPEPTFTGVQTLARLAPGQAPAPGEFLHWTVDSRGRWADYRWEISARALDLAVLEYVGPNGERLNCFNTCVADSRLTIAPRDGGAERTFESRRTTAFETAVPVG